MALAVPIIIRNYFNNRRTIQSNIYISLLQVIYSGTLAVSTQRRRPLLEEHHYERNSPRVSETSTTILTLKGLMKQRCIRRHSFFQTKTEAKGRKIIFISYIN